MIVTLNNVFNHRNRIIPGLSFQTWIGVIAAYWWIKIRVSGLGLEDFWFFMPLVVLATGILIEPYCVFMNTIRCYLNKKWFNRRFILRVNNLIMFTNYPRYKFIDEPKRIIGVVSGDVAYLDKYHEDIKDYIKSYGTLFYENLSSLIMDKIQSVDMIDKELVVFRLGDSG